MSGKRKQRPAKRAEDKPSRRQKGRPSSKACSPEPDRDHGGKVIPPCERMGEPAEKAIRVSMASVGQRRAGDHETGKADRKRAKAHEHIHELLPTGLGALKTVALWTGDHAFPRRAGDGMRPIVRRALEAGGRPSQPVKRR